MKEWKGTPATRETEMMKNETASILLLGHEGAVGGGRKHGDALDALGISETVSEICIPTKYTAPMQPVILPEEPAISVRRFSHLEGLLQASLI